MTESTTRVDRFVTWGKSNPFVSSVLIGGLCLGALAFAIDEPRLSRAKTSPTGCLFYGPELGSRID